MRMERFLIHIDRHPKLKSKVYLETLIKVVQHRD